MTLACRAAVAACIALVSVKAEATTTHEAAARHLTDISKPSVIHLDVYARGTSTFSGEGGVPTAPWFEGFLSGTGVWAAATIGHPIRRMLAHLREEGVELEEAVWWTKGEGEQRSYAAFTRDEILTYKYYLCGKRTRARQLLVVGRLGGEGIDPVCSVFQGVVAGRRRVLPESGTSSGGIGMVVMMAAVAALNVPTVNLRGSLFKEQQLLGSIRRIVARKHRCVHRSGLRQQQQAP